MRVRRAAVSLIPMLAVGVLPARAQTNDEVVTGTQFNFSTPGARSLAMGGAFLAVADDATAAFTNPAGLTQLARPEVSLEGRAWTYTSRFVAGGHSPGDELTGIGVDDAGGLRFGEIDRRVRGVSFLSAVWARPRWSVALYRHQLADFRAALDSQGAFVGVRESPNRLAPARSELALEVVNLGLAAALRVTDSLSLGMALERSDFSIDSLTRRYARAEPSGDAFADTLTGAYFGPADFRSGNIANFQEQHGDDGALAWSIGALWRIDSEWSLGATLRRGASFDYAATFTDGPAGQHPGVVDPQLSGPATFRVPDAYGIGLAWRPVEAAVLSCDWVHVEYSQMTDDLRNVLRAAVGERRYFQASDADEIHLGGEYQFLALRWPLALRAGVYLDPEHRIRYRGDSPTLRVRFGPGEDETHLSAGAGIVVGRAQFDVAFDHAPSVDTGSISVVARF